MVEEIKAFLEIVIQYASIWGPSIAAMAGIMISVVSSLAKVKTAVEEFKQDKTIDNLRSEMSEIKQELKETNRQNTLLIDELAKVHGYSAAKKKEGELK
jgi:uncharacterized protein YoxC